MVCYTKKEYSIEISHLFVVRGVIAEVASKVPRLLVHGLLVSGQGVTVHGGEAANITYLRN